MAPVLITMSSHRAAIAEQLAADPIIRDMAAALPTLELPPEIVTASGTPTSQFLGLATQVYRERGGKAERLLIGSVAQAVLAHRAMRLMDTWTLTYAHTEPCNGRPSTAFLVHGLDVDDARRRLERMPKWQQWHQAQQQGPATAGVEFLAGPERSHRGTPMRRAGVIDFRAEQTA